jgi:prepilin-type N-terminal cleavage/methylation domain-containing protein
MACWCFIAGEKIPKTGRTLTELLCVIVIIAILAAVFSGVIAKAIIHVKKILGDDQTSLPVLTCRFRVANVSA